MTRITIIAVGKRMPDWIESGFAEYKKRLSHELIVDLVEITPARRSKSANTRMLREEEAVGILKAIPERDHVIALDEHGKPFEFEADGLLAVCVQHEIDHLDGKVFVEYLSMLKQNRIRTRLRKRERERERELRERETLKVSRPGSADASRFCRDS